MMNRNRVVFGVWAMLVIGMVLALFVPSETLAQFPFNRDVRGNAGLEGVPSSALLTERGRQLANELRNLRRSRDVMGAKHPSLDVVNNKIKAIEEQLQAWAPASGVPGPNPFSGEAAGKERKSAAPPKINDVDLRQIVIQLNEKIIALEKRVAVLEGR